MKTSQKVKTKKYTLYIGFKDADTKLEVHDILQIKNVIQKCLKAYDASYSIDVRKGGYKMHSGDYIFETSLELVLIGADESVVNSIAADIGCFFNQEEVLVTCEDIISYNISNKLEK